MENITITPKDWQEVKDIVKKINSNLFQHLNEIHKYIKQPFLFEVIVPYGLDLIQNGIPIVFNKKILSKINFQKGSTQYNKDGFYNSFKCKFDQPLSLIVDGSVEIYNWSEYKYNSTLINYKYPLNYFASGEIFGVFGTADTLFNVKKSSVHFSYSASSGKSCIYPLLPDPGKGTKDYKNLMDNLLKPYDFRGSNISIVTLYNKHLHYELSKKINLPTKIFLIPDQWYLGNKKEFSGLQSLISNYAWGQSNYLKDKNFITTQILFAIGGLPKGGNDHLYASLIYSLDQSINGNQRLLKVADIAQEPFATIHCQLSDLFGKYYYPTIFHFDFLLKPHEWGIYPLITLPFEISSKTVIINSGALIKAVFEDSVNREIKKLPQLADFHKKLTPLIVKDKNEFMEKRLPNSFTKNIITEQVILISNEKKV
ncbi:MAG: hypothetical protein POELPBGB_02954 [Bacteroidia bacterium]|nr:hypothetical protein [Bacteroidia bacterium]